MTRLHYDSKYKQSMMIKHLPNLITLINIALGFLAILLNDPFWSPVLILGAGIADILDGLTARLLKAQSRLGEQLDSLADLISFGVAPSYLYYHHVLEPIGNLAYLIILLPVFGAVRLARFNLLSDKNSYFTGLPIPSVGYFIAFIVFAWDSYPSWIKTEWIALSIPLALSLLMISKLKMPAMKHFGEKTRAEKSILLILATLSTALIIIMQMKAIPLIVLLYVFGSLFYHYQVRTD